MKSKSEVERIAVQLKRAFDGEAWHGSALLEILDGVNAGVAAARPIANAHSIWELTWHIQGWEDVVRRRLGGEALTLSDGKNFPKIGDTSETAWKKTLEELRTTHEALLDSVSALPEARLGDRVPGKDYDVYFMLHGIVHHALYHAGQIVILTRALGK